MKLVVERASDRVRRRAHGRRPRGRDHPGLAVALKLRRDQGAVRRDDRHPSHRGGGVRHAAREGGGGVSAAPLVTGIIPVRDRAGLVARAIDSALAQSGPELELIVVDDGSSDATPAVLAGYGERIVAVRQPPSGRSAARNAGIAAARGDLDRVPRFRRRVAAGQARAPARVPRGASRRRDERARARAHPLGRPGRADVAGPGQRGSARVVPRDGRSLRVRAERGDGAHRRRARGGRLRRGFDGTEDLEFALAVAQRHRSRCFPTASRATTCTPARPAAAGSRAATRRSSAITSSARRIARRAIACARSSRATSCRRPSAPRRATSGSLLREAAEIDPGVRLRAAWLRQRFAWG